MRTFNILSLVVTSFVFGVGCLRFLVLGVRCRFSFVDVDVVAVAINVRVVTVDDRSSSVVGWGCILPVGSVVLVVVEGGGRGVVVLDKRIIERLVIRAVCEVLS